MTPELTTIMYTVSVGVGAGLGFVAKNFMFSSNGKDTVKIAKDQHNGFDKLSKAQHDEICKLKMDSIHFRFDTGDENFKELKKSMDDTRERLLERIDRMYKI